MSTLKMTFSLASLIFLIALGLVFVPTSVMAHEAAPADTAHNPALTDTTGHSLVSSITADSMYLSATGVVTLTVNFAPAVAAVPAGAGTDDDGSLHATTNPADFDALDDLVLQTMAADGTFTTSTATPFLLFGSVRQTRAPSSGVGAVYQVSVSTADPAVDGIYYLSATNAHTYNGTATSDQTKRVKIVADSNGPTLSEFMASATAGNTYEGDTGWTKPFEVSFNLMDDGTDGSGVKVDSIMVTADPADVTFTNVVRGRTASGFMVTATPKAVTANTAAKDIKISISATDMAGNAIDPADDAGTPVPVPTLTTKLAARTATTTATTPTGTGEMPFKHTIPAKSYVIVALTATPGGLEEAGALSHSTATGASKTTIQPWADIPNLEDLFFRGGSLSLTTLKATLLDRDKGADKSDETDPESAKVRDVIITEIMAARNTALVGKTGYLTHQWIELYNTLPVPVAVELVAKSGRPAPSAADTHVQLDLASNVVNPGWNFTGLGADGFDNSEEVKGTEIAPTYRPFTSFYRKERGKDGHTKGHWMTSTDTFFANHKGTPGASERSGDVAVVATNPTYNVVINEIGNYTNDAYDWIELRNVNQGDGNLKKWQLWEITGDKKKSTILNMPDNDSHKIGAVGDVLLIVATDPYRNPDHPLAAGHKINKDQANPETSGIKTPNSRYYVAGTGFKLANDGKSLLLLRSRNDGGDHEGIVDLTGTHFIADQSDAFATDVWPLKGQTKGNDNHGHGDVVKGDGDKNEDFRQGHVYQRINASRGTGKEVWERRGYTGIGYKRSASAIGQHGGTPGYDNGLIKEKDSDLAGTSSVSISEIMYQRGNRDNLPQWIELYNSSHTQAINLNEWKLKIENDRADVDVRSPAVTIGNLGGTIIHPNQTILIVAYSGRTSREGLSGTTDFPASRVINLSGKAELEIATDANKRNYRLLSGEAFKLTLIEKGGMVVDVAGNLGADPAWELPMNDVDEGRASIIRRYNEGATTQGGDGMANDGTMGVFSGKMNAGGMAGDSGWVYAGASDLAGARQNETYYGNADDLSTPGYRDGGPLPVSLSKFRPERLESGEIVVRWITESELNNAGFNILRSEKRDSGFTKVYFVAGKGTTSERTAYEWKDASAKPNVVYYYQIQDVSLDGEVTTLRTTHLRGNVSAAGKLTTTWGELKALQ